MRSPCIKNAILITAISLTSILLFPNYVLLFQLPDTGLSICYDDTEEIACPQPAESFYGQDGNYIINPPSLTKLDENANPLPEGAASWAMVRCNNTGLIWEVKTDNGSVHDKDNQYTWQQAKDIFIANLNTDSFGGFSDWRIPTVLELSLIIERGNAGFHDYFPHLGSNNTAYYWSVNDNLTHSHQAWSVRVADCGNIYAGYEKSDLLYLIAVRGKSHSESGRFKLNVGGSVTDKSTGLMWQRSDADPLTWQEALDHCEGLNLAGYNDWRLPNINELLSIVDYGRAQPAINTYYFPNTATDDQYWSSSTLYCGPLQANWAWVVEYAIGSDTIVRKFNPKPPPQQPSYEKRRVRCLRGGQNNLPDHLLILIPQQASNWEIESSMPITWETQGIPGNVTISLSRDGGKDGTFEIIAASTENDGSYDWQVLGPGSVNCMLKIIPSTEPSKETIQGLFVISQNPNEFPWVIFYPAFTGKKDKQ
jgi:hypothetical protein